MYEDGPDNILYKVREALGVEYDINDKPVSYHGIGTVFSCFWCLSIWVGLLIGGFTNVKLALALSALAIWIEKNGISSD